MREKNTANNEDIEKNPQVNISMGQYNGDGVIRCPNCGSTLKYMSLYCEFCGSELTGDHNPYSIKLFSEKVSRLHLARARSKVNVFTSAFGFGRKDAAEEELISLITDFQIPNTVGDITEFMIFASSNINPATFDYMLGMNKTGAKSLYEWNVMQRESNAWLTKMKQAYSKATVLFGNSSDFEKIERIYQNTLKDIDTNRKHGRRFTGLVILVCFVPLILMIVWLIVS
jgi:hypothetical protein